jgi:hypothetical protein
MTAQATAPCRRRRHRRIAALPALLLALSATLVPEVGMAVEEAPHRVLQKLDAFELREYDAYVVAEVIHAPGGGEGDNGAFRRLFGYISGKNAAKGDIAMTAPVITPPPERVAMTTPVTTQRLPDGVTMQFVLPARYTLDTAPQPSDPAVRLRAIPAGRVAVWRFSGSASDRKVADMTTLLRTAIGKAGLTAVGEPIVARYNAPFVPPFLRRNEVWLNVAP